MDVDVHAVGFRFQEQEIGGRIVFGHQFLVGLADGLVEEGRAEIAVVDEEELVAGTLAGVFGVADVTADPHQARVDLHLHQFLGEVHAENVEDALLVRSGRTQMVQFLSVGGELERNFGPDEGDALELLDDGPELGVVRLEELAPGGYVVKEVADGEVAAGRRGDGLRGSRFDGARFDERAGFVFGAAGFERDLGHGGDRGEGLAAETIGQDVLEIFGRGDLAGGVAREAEHGFVGRHAAAVVDDLDEGLAGVGHGHQDAFGAGVDGIFHQLLDHRGGAGDHLACGDQVRKALGKDLQHQLTSIRMNPFDR